MGLDRAEVEIALKAARSGKRGGVGRGGGRHTEDGVNAPIRKQIMLNQSSLDTLTEYGEGNLSLGIRAAARLIEMSLPAKKRG